MDALVLSKSWRRSFSRKGSLNGSVRLIPHRPCPCAAPYAKKGEEKERTKRGGAQAAVVFIGTTIVQWGEEGRRRADGWTDMGAKDRQTIGQAMLARQQATIGNTMDISQNSAYLLCQFLTMAEQDAPSSSGTPPPPTPADPAPAPAAPSPSSWKLPDGIEDHLESGKKRNRESRISLSLVWDLDSPCDVIRLLSCLLRMG
jgi:hypothetical protein